MQQVSTPLNIDVMELPAPPSVWTKEEHAQMLSFMDESRDFLLDNITRNINRQHRANKAHFFVRMSACIGTKTDKQCKSRYQKKERQLLKEMDFAADLVDAYLSSKREKNKKSATAKSPRSTEACNSMLRADEAPTNTISSFEQLRAAIVSEFMPRVSNDVVLGRLQNFVQSFPSDDKFVRLMPTHSISPLRFYQQSIGFSIDILPDPEIVFVEDCD